MKKTLWKSALLASVIVLVAGPLALAEVQSDFDPGGTYFGGSEGWFNYDGNPDFAVGVAPGGSTEWLAVKPQQYWGKITAQSWATPDVTVADWNSNTHLEFDIVVDDLWYPSALTTMNIEFQVTDGSAGTVNQYATPSIDTSLKGVVQHVSVPLAAMQPFDPTAPNWNLSFNLSPGYAWEWDAGNPSLQPYDPRYYIDNVQWTGAVPEPTSVVLLGACLTLFGVRRQR